MSAEALWKIKFVASDDREESWGTGVLVLESGRLLGGDSSFYYTGEYTIVGGRLDARLRMVRHSSGLPAALGSDEAVLLLKGEVFDEAIDIFGALENEPDRLFAAAMERLVDLP